MEDRIGGRVLELGCGTGKNTRWLAERAQQLVACDFSLAMLARVKERVPGVEFHLCDLRGEWPVDEVDVVVVDLVFAHESHTPLEYVGYVGSIALRRFVNALIYLLHLPNRNSILRIKPS